MRAVRLLKWSGSVLSPRTRPATSLQKPIRAIILQSRIQHRSQATATATVEDTIDENEHESSLTRLAKRDASASQPPHRAKPTISSAKLSALHARLTLPSRLPIESLARALIDTTADADPTRNNRAFSVLGADLLSYYTSEYIICQFPRLPLAVVFAAMNAYCGPKALAMITREWGVQPAATPGPEVDPGFLQFEHQPPGERQELPTEDIISTRPMIDPVHGKRRQSISSRTVYEDAFGQKIDKAANELDLPGVTLETASASFVRAVMGAIYLHAGRSAAKNFFKNHFMSRQLNMASLISFRTPTRDLSRLCAREAFQSPVARILSETGRLSRHPVFIVGVFSGKEKLGEGAGSSLDEARTRAAVAALKAWYLYSPVQWRLPSDAEEPNAKPWASQYVDVGDIVV